MRKTVLLQTMLLTSGSFVLLILLHPMVNMLGSRKRNSMLLFCAQIAYLLVVSIWQLLLWRFFISINPQQQWIFFITSWCHLDQWIHQLDIWKRVFVTQLMPLQKLFTYSKVCNFNFDEWFSQSLVLLSLCQHISKQLQLTFVLELITMNNLGIQIKLADVVLKFIRLLRF